MKFLSKRVDSEVLAQGLIYQENRGVNNKCIHDLLLAEQKSFCAYTEKYVVGLDSTEVEHLNSSKKYADDYYNYYVVLRKANEYKLKKDNHYRGAQFFESLFFQNKEEFDSRIQYVDGVYEEVHLQDFEARDFIDFLGFNEHPLYEDRKKHVKRLKALFEDANWDNEKRLQYLSSNPNELSFITALEIELGLNLAMFYQ